MSIAKELLLAQVQQEILLLDAQLSLELHLKLV